MLLTVCVAYESWSIDTWDDNNIGYADIAINIDENLNIGNIAELLSEVWSLHKQFYKDKEKIRNTSMKLAREIISRGGVIDVADVDLNNAWVYSVQITNGVRRFPFLDVTSGSLTYEVTPGNNVRCYPETIVEGIKLIKKYANYYTI